MAGIWAAVQHKECRKALQGLAEALDQLRSDHEDLHDRYNRLQGRLAKRGELSEPKSPGSQEATDFENGGRAAALNAAIRAKDHVRVKEIRAHVPRQG